MRKLSDITPESCVAETAQLLAEHIAGLSWKLQSLGQPSPLLVDRSQLTVAEAIATESEGAKSALEKVALRAHRIGHESAAITAESIAQSSVAVTIRDLVEYAKSGNLHDWGSHAGALDAIQSVIELLYASPIDHTNDSLPMEAPGTQIGTVICAALARHAMAEGRPVAQRWLAALTGESDRTIRRRAEDGTLKFVTGGDSPRDRGMVSAKSASKYAGLQEK